MATYEDRLTLEAWNGLGRPEVILEDMTSPLDTSFTLDLSGIDWDRWEFVAVLCRWYPVDSDATLSVTLTDMRSYGHFTGAAGARLILFFPRHDATRKMRCFIFPNGDLQFSELKTYADITTIRFSRTGNYSFGASPVTVYGIS